MELISVKHIMEEIAYCVAQHITNLGKQPIFQGWDNRLAGVLAVIAGTSLFPLGTPQEIFVHDIYLPKNFIDELKTDKYWPMWFKKEDLGGF